MSNIHKELKTKIHQNPKNLNKILETLSIRHNTNKDSLIEQFIEQELVHPSVYASLVSEYSLRIDEDLTSFIKNSIGKASDALLAKYGFGGTALKAQGNQERRARMEFLFSNWVKLSAKASLVANANNLKTFLQAVKINPKVILNVLNLFKQNFKQAVGTLDPNKTEAILPKEMFRSFFDKVAELEQQDALKQLAAKNTVKPKAAITQTTKPATSNTQSSPQAQAKAGPLTQQDIETYISKLPSSERASFVTKNILPSLSDADVQGIVKNIFAKRLSNEY